uniref:metallophosphoesterase family protein n=1 Tax=Eubacterium cellulosolvens TaxID=29322 RepID=UPI000486AC53|nr:metallophosphoesterase [[Eubacterium] cellulosolvens]
MKILVVSDTHGYGGILETIVKREQPLDFVIHCGDIEGEEDEILAWAGCRTFMVSGNNDWGSDLPAEFFTEVGGCRIFATHGHRYQVYMGTDRLAAEAFRRGADICLFGHTHKPLIEKKNSVTIMNPGSLTYPRQEGRKPSYGIITGDAENGFYCKIRYVEKKI